MRATLAVPTGIAALTDRLLIQSGAGELDFTNAVRLGSGSSCPALARSRHSLLSPEDSPSRSSLIAGDTPATLASSRPPASQRNGLIANGMLA